MATRKTPRPAPQPRGGAAQTRAAIGLSVGGVIALIAVAVWIASKPTPSEVRAEPGPPAPAVAPITPPPASPRPPAPRPPSPPPAPPSPSPPPAPVEVEPEVTEPEAPAPTFATAWARGPTEQVTVKRCVDGDTLETQDGRKVRLIGINTPERDMPLYGEAKDLLRELVDGQQVTLEWDQERTDQYRRCLAYVFKGEMFVNGEIVRRGLAFCYTWEPNTAHRTEFITFQREARAAKAGLWALPPPAPERVYVADRQGHHFHRPTCGRVERIRGARRLEFPSRDEAIDTGQNPCTECKP